MRPHSRHMWPHSLELGFQGAGHHRCEVFSPLAAVMGAGLLLGDLKHAEALILLQKLILRPDLLPEAV